MTKNFLKYFIVLITGLLLLSCSERNTGQNPVPAETINTPTATLTSTVEVVSSPTATATLTVTPTATATVNLYAEIYGTVYKRIDWETDYNAFQGAEVLLWQSGSAVDTCVTDSLGEYIFTDVVPGTYDVVVKIADVGYTTEYSQNNGGWVSIPYTFVYAPGDYYTYMTKTAVTVAAGDSVSVDFRFVGY